MLKHIDIIDELKIYMPPSVYSEHVHSNSDHDDIVPVPPHDEWMVQLAAFSADVIVIVTYLKLIPMEITKYAKYGVMNIHPSLLPKYRGGSPIFFALKNGDKEIGVTYHFISEAADQGPIIAQETVKVAEHDCAVTVWMKITRKMGQRLPKLLAEAERWSEMSVVQNESEATHCPFATKSDRTIDFRLDSGSIENLVKACGRVQGAFASAHHNEFQICEVRPVALESLGDQAESLPQEPGRLVEQGGKLLVRTGSGYLEVYVSIWDGVRYEGTIPTALLQKAN